uniref:Uncharacterized protein n=1 Tax=Anguilla anguilla TaxID=7936 RepID=A0A0E9W4Q8_ANGAN
MGSLPLQQLLFLDSCPPCWGLSLI